ncbi:unnamed protein product [Cuscuta europaea]|uniref:Uncharacterized protein n=1 Tax=Cuscuta europaea TaxID=41803 RepID=A0A9P1A1Q1_CUSEU|nr:unnamed protein product [Cuscuta europaea]
MIKTVLQTPFLETMSLLPKEAPRLDEPVGKGSHPLDQGGSHTCVNPFFGEVEGVGEGSPPLDQTVSHTYFNPLFGEDEVTMYTLLLIMSVCTDASVYIICEYRK